MEIQAEQVERYCEIRDRSGAQVSRNLECCPAHLTPCRNGRGLTVESKFWKWTVSPKNDPLTGSERGSQFSESIGKSEES